MTTAMLTDQDMTIMRVLHKALRRDGERLERSVERFGVQDAETHDALLLGWHGFSSSLQQHHGTEDRYIWPVMRAKLTDRPDDLAVLDAMEEEHSRIDPAIEAVEEAFDDPAVGADEVAARIARFVELLRSHLDHEERDCFPLMRTLITRREWGALNRSAMREVSFSELAALGPWVLDGASPDEVRTVLSEFPPPLRLVHRYWWNPRYQEARRWE